MDPLTSVLAPAAVVDNTTVIGTPNANAAPATIAIIFPRLFRTMAALLGDMSSDRKRDGAGLRVRSEHHIRSHDLQEESGGGAKKLPFPHASLTPSYPNGNANTRCDDKPPYRTGINRQREVDARVPPRAQRNCHMHR
ncbi:MAG: hypothetical protein ABSG81_15100 [Acidimicrobiales bacterium]